MKNASLKILAAAALLVSMSSFAADGDKSEIEGMITTINGNAITVKDSNNVAQTFTVSAKTKIRSKKVIGSDTAMQTALMPGLPIPPRHATEGHPPFLSLFARPLVWSSLLVELLATPLGSYAFAHVGRIAHEDGLAVWIASAAVAGFVAGPNRCAKSL